MLNALLLALSEACEGNEMGPQPSPGDYFPTAAGLQWYYLGVNDLATYTRVPILTAQGDTIIRNRTYAKSWKRQTLSTHFIYAKGGGFGNEETETFRYHADSKKILKAGSFQR